MYSFIGIAFYYYAGSQNPIVKIVQSGSYSNLDDIVILAEKTEYVAIFAYVLSSDCMIIGILWILYIFKYEIFHGTFFRYLVFSIDFIFDMFYAIFPLLLIGDNNLTFVTAAASVNSKSFVLLSSLIPIIYIIFKLFAILRLVSKLTQKQFYHSFHIKKQKCQTQKSQIHPADKKSNKDDSATQTQTQMTPNEMTLTTFTKPNNCDLHSTTATPERTPPVSPRATLTSRTTPRDHDHNRQLSTSMTNVDSCKCNCDNNNNNNMKKVVSASISCRNDSIDFKGISNSDHELAVFSNVNGKNITINHKNNYDENHHFPTHLPMPSISGNINYNPGIDDFLEGITDNTCAQEPQRLQSVSTSTLSQTNLNDAAQDGEDKNETKNDDQNENNDDNDSDCDQDSVRLTPCDLCCHGKKFIVPLNEAISVEKANRKLFIIQYCRRITTLILASLVILYGILLGYQMYQHTTYDIGMCDNYKIHDNMTNIDLKYAYLYAWDNCLYKVHPFTDETPCQCRNMVVKDFDVAQWYDALNSSRKVSMIFESMLKEYYMLETLLFDGAFLLYTNEAPINFTDQMMVSKNLKVLTLQTLAFHSITPNFGENWKKLEFLRFAHVFSLTPTNLDSLAYIQRLAYLSIEYSFLTDQKTTDDSNWICKHDSLRYIGFSSIFHKEKIPSCVYTFEHLEWAMMEWSVSFDARIFFLKQLAGLSAYSSLINASSLELQLELIFNTTDLSWNEVEGKEIFLQASEVCAEFEESDESDFKLKYPLVYHLIEITNGCKASCDNEFDNLSCVPYWFHNGMFWLYLYCIQYVLKI